MSDSDDSGEGLNPPLPPMPRPDMNPPAQRQLQFHLNPAASFRGILDYSTSASKKLYKSATSSLFDAQDKYNCEPDEMLNFLRELDTRAIEYGWDDEVSGILWIPQDVNDPASDLKYLPREYGTISIDSITNFERTYLGQELRTAQDSYMLYMCLLNSLTKEAKMKIQIWENEYIIVNQQGTRIPSGNLLLKVIIRESHLDTNATTQSIRTKLSNLDRYIATIGNDITKFNGYVKGLVQSLAARGERTEDLLSNLFKGYQAVSDRVFLKYIAGKQEKYEEGKQYSPDQLMQLADNKYRLLKEKGIWDTPSELEEKILALEAKIAELTRSAKRTRSSKRKKKGSDGEGDNPEKKVHKVTSNQQEKPQWMYQRPSESELKKPRTWNGAQWWFCHRDTGGKCDGVYRIHKPQDCKGTARSKTQKRDSKPHEDSDQDQSRKMKLANAMSTIIHSDGSSTVSETSDYEA